MSPARRRPRLMSPARCLLLASVGRGSLQGYFRPRRSSSARRRRPPAILLRRHRGLSGHRLPPHPLSSPSLLAVAAVLKAQLRVDTDGCCRVRHQRARRTWGGRPTRTSPRLPLGSNRHRHAPLTPSGHRRCLDVPEGHSHLASRLPCSPVTQSAAPVANSRRKEWRRRHRRSYVCSSNTGGRFRCASSRSPSPVPHLHHLLFPFPFMIRFDDWSADHLLFPFPFLIRFDDWSAGCVP